MSSISASEIVRALGGLTGEAREHEIIRYGEAGNLPAALWRFVTVTSTRKDARGKEHTFSYDVSFDFFSLGVDTDYIRIPMWPITAQRLLDAWQCTLPTPRMVEQIHKQSVPIVMPTTSTARGSTAAYANTNGFINAAVKAAKVPIGTLISGHRKDVVISKGLHDHPDNVVIYAGLKSDGSWWQTRSNATSHSNRYVDYSHGFRFVRWDMRLDGEACDIRMVLRDPVLAPLLSADGPLPTLKYPLLPKKTR
jgi:hypothetical protein